MGLGKCLLYQGLYSFNITGLKSIICYIPGSSLIKTFIIFGGYIEKGKGRE